MWTYHYIYTFRLISHSVDVNLPLYLHISLDFALSWCEPTTTSRHFAKCRTRYPWTYHYTHTFRLISHSVGVNLPLYPHVSVDVTLGGCKPTTTSTNFAGCRARWVWTYYFIHTFRLMSYSVDMNLPLYPCGPGTTVRHHHTSPRTGSSAPRRTDCCTKTPARCGIWNHSNPGPVTMKP